MIIKACIWICYSLVCLAVMAFVVFAALRHGTGCIWAVIAAVFFLIVGHFETRALNKYRRERLRDYWAPVYKD